MEMSRSAWVEDTHRYRLDRWWGDGPRVGWVMLNPSTADALEDDPTIRRCIGFAKDWGYDGITVVNLFGLRATDPKELLRTYAAGGQVDVTGLGNYPALAQVMRECPIVVCAWGANPAVDRIPHADIPAVADWCGGKLVCLGTTKAGHPRHPLYLPKDAQRMPFPGVPS